MIRKIFVPIRGDGKGETVLGYANALAQRFEAHVDATHCRPRAEDLNPFGVPIPAVMREQFVKQAKELADTEESRLRDEFDAIVKRFGLLIVDAPDGKGPSISWSEESGKQVDVIKGHGRLADILVVAKPDRDRNLGANTLKAAIFNAGRPVLMCPPGPVPNLLGEHVAIAWNGSLEATRAVAQTLDVLKAASKVTVLIAGAEEIHGATAADLEAYLALHGVGVRLHRFDTSKRIGDALLEQTAAVGADMLIMGAYSDSHERETLFGGNTQVVVDGAELPVILVH